MDATTNPFLNLAPMLAALIVAGCIDAATRRIPNWLTFGLILAGLARATMPHAPVSLFAAIVGMCVAAAVPLAMFILGAIGGGDVKLLAAIGAWVGAIAAVHILVVTALLAMVIALVQCAATGKLKALFRNSAVVAINLAHVNDLGVEHTAEVGKQFRSIDRPLPYAVPILLSVFLLAFCGAL